MQEFLDFEIKNYTAFKIGGTISKVYFPESAFEFIELLKKNSDLLVFGGLSNVLISSNGIKDEIVLTKKLSKYTVVDNVVTAECGAMVPLLSRFARDNELSGFEFMCGFPGTVGGAVYMNASAHKQSISDVFLSARVFDRRQSEVITLLKKDMNFAYRHSVLQSDRYVLIDAKFELSKVDVELITNRMNENQSFRKDRQPNLSRPNAGSVFRNPDGNSAGALLDEVGAKQLAVGGANVYEKHANFIVNDNNATSLDVSKLMKSMYNKVKERYNICLKPEIKYFGIMSKEEEEIWNELLNN